MRKERWVFLMLLMFTFLLSSSGTDGEELTAQEIMRRVEFVNDAKFESNRMTMDLINQRGQVRHRLIMQFTRTRENGEQDSLAEFLEPSDVKGTRFLTYEHLDSDDDQWLYLPALRKVRRISAADRTDYFMGSDFTFEDIRSEHLNSHEYKIIAEEKVDGFDCWVIEAVPSSEEERENSGYSKRQIWVTRDHFVEIQAKFWNKKGEFYKILKGSDVREIAPDIWRANRLEVLDNKRKHKTVIIYEEREVDMPIDEEVFSQRALERGL